MIYLQYIEKKNQLHVIRRCYVNGKYNNASLGNIHV